MSNRDFYDKALEKLDDSVREMSEKVQTAIAGAIEALYTLDQSAAAQIVTQDEPINELERAIEHQCMTLLLRQQPVASDLRRVTAALKVVTDLERLGDHAVDICEIVQHLEQEKPAGTQEASDVYTMAREASAMVSSAVEAFLNRSLSEADAVIDRDDVVDGQFNDIKMELAKGIAADPESIDSALDYLMVIKYLERIGDHAVNVAEWTKYCGTGMYKNERIV